MWCGGNSGPHHILSLSLLTSYLARYLSMNRQRPSRSAAAHPTGSNPYGGGAPHGDPFDVAAPTGGPVYIDARSLGHGPPPPSTPRAFRSTLLDTSQVLPRHGAVLTQGRAVSQHVYDPSLVTTPTPNRYNVPSRPPVAAPPQFVIPEERTQMEHVLDMMQMLLNGQAELSRRMSNVESTLQQQQPSVPARGLAVQRGGRVMRSKRTTRGQPRLATTPASDESDPDGLQPATSATNSSDTDRESESMDDDGTILDKIDVSAKEKGALQSYVTKTFRRVCKVPGRHWPDPTLDRSNPITQEVYPTPVFATDVSDPQNHALFHQVAHQAFTELKDHDCWPQTLRRPSQQPPPTWDFAYMFQLAKESFRNLKKQWNEVQQVEAAIKGDDNRRTNRHLKRRTRKSQKLTKILYAFAAKHGLDPGFLADLIHEQFLSDEASGPEDDSIESNDAWKVRMASEAGLPLDPDSQKQMKILEILTPAWRSESYSRLIQAMQDFAVDDSSPAEEASIYHRVDAGRVSDRLPRYAPYDFGISP
ncbi:hypothetical protein C8R44DRAFT_990666 [Mycena epipterygia]|nr:hypothetical protein C8R44DRAFT_990666 [Mycena epipterygia]